MRAQAVIRAEERAGATFFPTLRSEPPILVRQVGTRLLLVGGAAGPLGGDELGLRIEVGPGAVVRIGSAAASLVLPGPTPSEVTLDVIVGSGARLEWAPEPLISAAGSDHHQRTTIRLADDAVLRWRESVVCGRSGEGPGALRLAMRVERAGRVMLHQDLDLGPVDPSDQEPVWWRNPAVLAGAGAMITDLAVNGQLPAPSVGTDDDGVAVFDLGPRARMTTGVGPDLAGVARRLLAEGGRAGVDPQALRVEHVNQS